MFVHELTDSECREVLRRSQVGRLACSHEQQPYVVPMNFAFDGHCIYSFTTRGQKVEWMRANPLVCFEVDEVTGQNNWTSIVIIGRYEELTDKPELEEARMQAHAFLSKRAMWWEPAYIAQDHRDEPHSLTPVFFRIHMNKMTGHRANSDSKEESDLLSSHREEKTKKRKARFPRLWSILKAAVSYFAIVFGIGSLLGSLRVLFVAPSMGERLAEMLEAPLMLGVILLAAIWIVRKFQLPAEEICRLAVGTVALFLGIIFELTLVVALRGITLRQYFETRDPSAGTVYYLTLILFALMPLVIGFRRQINR